MGGCSQGALSRLLVEPGASPHTFDVNSEIYDFNYETIAKQGTLVGGKGIAGTRSNFANRIREGSYLIAGQLSTYACPADLDYWLPRILGKAEAADVFDVDDSLQPFGLLLNRVAGTFKYSDCYVNRALWKCEAGPGDGDPEVIEQILDIYAMAEDSTASWPGSVPTLSTAVNRNPFICADGTLTIGGVNYYFHEFTILVHNHIQPRWVNSLTPTALCPQDRTVMLRASFPFTSTADAVLSGLYQNASRHSGVTASLVMRQTASAYGTTWTFTGLQWAQVSPTVGGKKEIVLSIDFVARKTGAASELVVTNDNTP